MLLIMSYWTKLIMMLGKLQRAHLTLRGHFAPTFLVGINMPRAHLFFIYALTPWNDINVGNQKEAHKKQTLIDSPEKVGYG